MPTAIPRVTKRVETLLARPDVNSKANDYHAYGRTLPGYPAPLFGQQYKFGKVEAQKLTKQITAGYDVATQKRIVKELYARSSTRNLSKGTLALTRDGAAELNKLSKR